MRICGPVIVRLCGGEEEDGLHGRTLLLPCWPGNGNRPVLRVTSPIVTEFRAAAVLWGVWLAAWLLASRGTAKTVIRQTFASRVFHSAPSGLGAALLFFDSGRLGILERAIFSPSTWIGWIGVALIALGLAWAGWARIHLGRLWSATVTLKADHTIIRSGPYALTRHPIYTGLLCALLGTTVVRDSSGALLGFALCTLGFLLKIRQEEQLLTTHFGDAYRDYRGQVPSLIPFL